MDEEQEDFQRKPQICLIDLDKDVEKRLTNRGLNIDVGTLGARVQVSHKGNPDSVVACFPNWAFPSNLHEFDIIIVDLKETDPVPLRSQEHCFESNERSVARKYLCQYPTSVFNPKPIGSAILNDSLQDIFKHQGILIVFAHERHLTEYRVMNVGYGLAGSQLLEPFSLDIYEFANHDYSNLIVPNSKNKEGYEIKVCPKENKFSRALGKFLDGAHYYIAFQHPTIQDTATKSYIPDPNFLPVLLNGRDEIVGFARIFRNNLLLVLPQFEQKGEILEELLTTVLPDVVPSLFPYNTESQWLEDPAYLLPHAQELLEQKDEIKNKFEAEIARIDERIEKNSKGYKWLHELLTKNSGELVTTVKTFFEWLGFENIRDMDEINSSLKEEDLQVDMKSGLLVVEVKGIHGTSKDDECSQVNKFVTRRMKERGSTDVQGLYVVNHQRHLPPLDRQNPPFSETQVKDAVSDGRGLLTTWQLFNLYFSIENGAISKEEAREAIRRAGLITFEPQGSVLLGRPIKLYQNDTVLLFEDTPRIAIGDRLLIKRDERYLSVNIKSIRVDDRDVREAENCGVGIKIDVPVRKTDDIYLKHP